MAKATWNKKVIAECDNVVEVEGNLYFPQESLQQDFFRDSTKQTTCPWKGVAHYYDLIVDGKTNEGAAWYYPDPKSAASKIRGHVAFWRGVETER